MGEFSVTSRVRLRGWIFRPHVGLSAGVLMIALVLMLAAAWTNSVVTMEFA